MELFAQILKVIKIIKESEYWWVWILVFLGLVSLIYCIKWVLKRRQRK